MKTLNMLEIDKEDGSVKIMENFVRYLSIYSLARASEELGSKMCYCNAFLNPLYLKIG